MSESQFYDQIQILHSSQESLIQDAVLISNNHLISFGDKAREEARKLDLIPKSAPQKLLAPCLVDPHSILDEPITGLNETLISLRAAAARSGYGHIALLPRSSSWRDQPEKLQGFNNPNSDVYIHLWGGFSKNGLGQELSPHAHLLQHGAIGLSEDEFIPPLELLQKGLLLGEMKKAPLLLAPRDINIQGDGIVRSGIEALRAGWAIDPLTSETLPLTQILNLYDQHPNLSLRLMNLSTAKGVEILSLKDKRPMATVCWWHLIADSASLEPTELGWRVSPSIGGSDDREALTRALQQGILTGVAVHAVPLSDEETKQPPDQRTPGLAGHHLVLPSLWQKLIKKGGWPIEKLWQVISFGPSRILNLPEERLTCGSRRWLIFDPNKTWIQNRNNTQFSKASNQPLEGQKIIGQITACGLRN